MHNVRVRFAPSPTGYVHIGSLRTALFNWIFARKRGGACILRIEDTDRARLVAGSVENLLSTFTWLGIDFDEGPHLEKSNVQERGATGPYFQSQRLDLYNKYALQLIEQGNAYWCDCSPQRLEKMRTEQREKKLPPMYDGACREKQMKTGLVIRLKVPKEGTTVFTDTIKGQVAVDNATIDDQVLLKSDGFPTYHLAVVVDDHLMEISHVIRADEWLISTPKHVLLYRAFRWEIPVFVHLPLILAPDKSKLSKRMGSVAVEEFRTEGYLPEALINFVTLLGWHPEGDKEILTHDDIIRQFSLDRIQKSPAIFDRTKLDWINGQYIRALKPEQFAKKCLPFLPRAKNEAFDYITRALATEQGRIKKLSEIEQGTEFFFKEPEYDPDLLLWKKSTPEQTKKNLEKINMFLANEKALATGDALSLESALKSFIVEQNLDTGSVLWPLRVALTGRKNSPGPFEVAAVLGKEKTLARLQKAKNMLP